MGFSCCFRLSDGDLLSPPRLGANPRNAGKGTGGVIRGCLLRRRPGSIRNFKGGGLSLRRGRGICVVEWNGGGSFLLRNGRFTKNGLINGKNFRLRNAGGFGKNSKNGMDYPPRIKRKFAEDSAPHNGFTYGRGNN